MSSILKIDDVELFRDYVADVVPLRQDYIEPFQHRSRMRPSVVPDPLHGTRIDAGMSESEVTTDALLDFARPGVQLRLLHKLRQGHLEPQLELDLHGLTVLYAQENLELFLAECRRRALRCVRIIHGKGSRSQTGQAVLKSKVNYWLRCYDFVLAFTSAPSWDGGSGAVYVLLRNPHKG